MALVSVVIPVKNEEANIRTTVEAIRKEFDQEHLHFEIIVILDGSTDGTPEIARQLAQDDPRIHWHRNKPPYGFGNAVKKGLDHFQGEYVIIAMGDYSDDPKDMVAYVRQMEKGYNCCFGSRWTKGAVVRGYPKVKLIINRLANAFINVLFGLGYDDVTNAFKCYSRETIKGVKPILSRHFNITVELPLKAIIRGYTYTVVPTNWYERRQGKTNLRLQEMGSRYLFIVLYVWLEKILCASDYKKQ